MRLHIQCKHIVVLPFVLCLLVVSVMSSTSAQASSSPHYAIASGDGAMLTTTQHQVSGPPGKSISFQLTATNTGTTTWGSGYDLKCLVDPYICPNPSYFGINGLVTSGNYIIFNIKLIVPVTSGSYPSTWSMTDGGNTFGNSVTVIINVAATPTSTPTATPTFTPTATATPTFTPTATLTAAATATATLTATATADPKSRSKYSVRLVPPTDPVSAQVGRKITFTLKISNDGQSTLTNSTISLQCDGYCSPMPSLPNTLKVSPGETQEFTITLAPAKQSGTYRCILTVEKKGKQGAALDSKIVTINVKKEQTYLETRSKSTTFVSSTSNMFMTYLWLLGGGACGLLALVLYLCPIGPSSAPFFNRVLNLVLSGHARE